MDRPKEDLIISSIIAAGVSPNLARVAILSAATD
jgi:hypothetical protein